MELVVKCFIEDERGLHEFEDNKFSMFSYLQSREIKENDSFKLRVEAVNVEDDSIYKIESYLFNKHDELCEFLGKFEKALREDGFVACDECGHLFNGELNSVNCGRMWLCDACLEDKQENGEIESCEECGKLFKFDDNDSVQVAHNGDFHIYCCESCAIRAGFFRCDCCGEWTPNIEETIVEDSSYCSSCCESEGVGECEGCGELFTSDHLNYCESDGFSYCDDCYESVEVASFDGSILSYHAVSNWTPHFLENESDSPMFYGFELEVQAGNKVSCEDEAIKIFKKLEEFGDEELFAFEEDGSLTRGFEIISQPLSWNWILKNQDFFKKILEDLGSDEFRGHDASCSCGLHVHFTRGILSDSEEEKLIYLFQKIRKFLEKFSRRSSSSLERWASFDDNYNCEDEKIFNKHGNKKSGHSYVLNFQSGRTIECRLFKSTLKFDSFMACLELVKRAVELSQQLTESDLIKKSENELINLLIDKTVWLKNYCREREYLNACEN